MAQPQRRRGELQVQFGSEGSGGADGSGTSTGGPFRSAGGRGWAAARRALLTSHARHGASNINLFSGGAGGGGGIPVSIPEEDAETDLHLAFRTQSSLSVIKELFYIAIEEKGREHVCSEQEASSGRLLLHCIGLNAGLILNNDGSIGGSSAGLVDEFILNELLPSYPSAIIEEDDAGNLPFMEVLTSWVKERKDARHRAMLSQQDSGRRLADIVQLAARAFFSKRTLDGLGGDQESATLSRDGEGTNLAAERSLFELPPLVEWSLSMLSAIITSKRRYHASASKSSYEPFGESNQSLGVDPFDLVSEDASKAADIDGEFDSLFVINEKGTIEMVNDAAVNEFGWSQEEFLGANISMICGESHGPRHDEYLSNYLKTGIKKVMGKHDRKLFAKRKDGTEFPISLGITETQAGEGMPRRFCGFVKHRREKKTANVRKSSIGHRPFHTGADISDTHSDVSSVGLSSLRPDATFGAVYNELIVESIAAIPGIVKELLLVEDQTVRERVFALPIIQPILLSMDSFGDGKWLIELLTVEHDSTKRENRDLAASKRGSVFAGSFADVNASTGPNHIDSAEAVIFYLEQVSNLDDADSTRIIMRGGDGTIREKRKTLYDGISNVEGLIRSLVVLDSELLKRAAVSRVIQRTLDQKIFSPFALTSALFDGIFHVMFIAAFRLGPAEGMFHLSASDASFRPQQYLVASVVLIGCISYFLRKRGHLAMSKKFAKPDSSSSVLSRWDLFQVGTLFLAAYCTLAVDWNLRRRARDNVADTEIPFHLRSLVALTTPLLWFRILGHSKMFNKQLATFILCSVEILRDIKWFMLVLMIIIASFAQMLVSMTFDPLQNQGRDSSEYSFVSTNEYLKAYTIMLGDIDSESLQRRPGIIILFVLYTFGVTIVLLNILIAIVSESYVNAVFSSTLMLGKARVMFVAELMSMKSSYTSGTTQEARAHVSKRNLDLGVFALGVLWTKLMTVTVLSKLACQDTRPDQIFLGLTALDIEGGITILVMRGFIVVHKYAMQYSLRTERRRGPGNVGLAKLSSRIKFWDTLANNLHSYISRNIDSLTEEDYRKEDQPGNLQQASETRAATRAGADSKLHRALTATRKELKAEIKRSSNQLRHVFHEVDEKTQASIALCEHHVSSSLVDVAEMQDRLDRSIAASEERIVEALTRKLEQLSREGSASGQENSGGEHTRRGLVGML